MSKINCSIALTADELIHVVNQNHFAHQKTILIKAYNEIIKRLNPIAYFYVVEDTVTAITSLGIEVDELQEEYRSADEHLYTYAIECLSMPLLEKVYQALSDHLWENGHGAISSYEFLGDRLPMEQAADIFARLDPTEISYNEAYMFIPKKTTLFIGTLSKKNSKGCTVCDQCSRENCVYREPKKSIVEYSYGYQRIFKK